MGEARTLTRLDHPHPLLLGGSQMFDSKPFGDHLLPLA